VFKSFPTSSSDDEESSSEELLDDVADRILFFLAGSVESPWKGAEELSSDDSDEEDDLTDAASFLSLFSV
jgi:hypothetical protein